MNSEWTVAVAGRDFGTGTTFHTGTLRGAPKQRVEIVARDAEPRRRDCGLDDPLAEEQTCTVDHRCLGEDRFSLRHILQQPGKKMERLPRNELSTHLVSREVARLKQRNLRVHASGRDRSRASRRAAADDCEVELGMST